MGSYDFVFLFFVVAVSEWAIVNSSKCQQTSRCRLLSPSSLLETLSIIPWGDRRAILLLLLLLGNLSVVHRSPLASQNVEIWFSKSLRCRHKVCSPSIFIMKYSPNKFKLRGRPLPAAYLSVGLNSKIQNWYQPSIQRFLSSGKTNVVVEIEMFYVF